MQSAYASFRKFRGFFVEFMLISAFFPPSVQQDLIQS